MTSALRVTSTTLAVERGALRAEAASTATAAGHAKEASLTRRGSAMVRVRRRWVQCSRGSIRKTAWGVRVADAVRTVAVSVVAKREAAGSGMAGGQAARHVDHMPG